MPPSRCTDTAYRGVGSMGTGCISPRVASGRGANLLRPFFAARAAGYGPSRRFDRLGISAAGRTGHRVRSIVRVRAAVRCRYPPVLGLPIRSRAMLESGETPPRPLPRQLAHPLFRRRGSRCPAFAVVCNRMSVGRSGDHFTPGSGAGRLTVDRLGVGRQAPTIKLADLCSAQPS